MTCLYVFFKCSLDGFVAGKTAFFCTFDGVEHALVILWEDLEELASGFWPVGEDALGALRTGEGEMLGCVGQVRRRESDSITKSCELILEHFKLWVSTTAYLNSLPKEKVKVVICRPDT